MSLRTTHHYLTAFVLFIKLNAHGIAYAFSPASYAHDAHTLQAVVLVGGNQEGKLI